MGVLRKNSRVYDVIIHKYLIFNELAPRARSSLYFFFFSKCSEAATGGAM